MKNNNGQPQYAVELDLTTASNAAFHEAIAKFYDWSRLQPPVGPLGIPNGWYRVTPLPLAQDFLRRNECNRTPSLVTVKKYHYSMITEDWRKTGQGLVFDETGKMNEGQQRCLASYFGKVSFDTYIVGDVPVQTDAFAYYDDVKPRSAADALHTSGLDGLATYMTIAIFLSHRYDSRVLDVFKRSKGFHKLNNREVLAYSRAHSSLTDTGHFIVATYSKALSLIGDKGVTIFFCDRVIANYGKDVLENFLLPLGTGANLAEDSPILALRTRLLLEGEDVSRERKLALLIKAFRYFQSGKKVTKQGLFVRDNEKFPRIEPVEEMTPATE